MGFFFLLFLLSNSLLGIKKKERKKKKNSAQSLVPLFALWLCVTVAQSCPLSPCPALCHCPLSSAGCRAGGAPHGQELGGAGLLSRSPLSPQPIAQPSQGHFGRSQGHPPFRDQAEAVQMRSRQSKCSHTSPGLIGRSPGVISALGPCLSCPKPIRSQRVPCGF